MKKTKKTAISLFCGAGGMDIGFRNAGFDIIWANDLDRDACSTYEKNFGSHIVCGDINQFIPTLKKCNNVDCLFGGPPCQGFSVAGYMDPNDERSKLVFSFMQAVKHISPQIFIMENVKSLATLNKFELVRKTLFKHAEKLGYKHELIILNSKDFGVPQSRERMFFIGYKNKALNTTLGDKIKDYQAKSRSVRETLAPLGPAGTAKNSKVVNAKITLAKDPILRKSPYAGMLFNGQGRPLNPDTFSSTLHASMGGNRTPIIDEEQLYHNRKAWVEEYHKYLMSGGKPHASTLVPQRLRRMTVDEAHLLQTFPPDFKFVGTQSSVFRQIGNAVPCNLAFAVARLVMDILDNKCSAASARKSQTHC